MRLIRVPLAFAVLASVVAMAPSPAIAEEGETPPVVFEGHGWGHGVGMSQYGARAMAADGFAASEIVEHYYTDASTKSLSAAVSGWLVNDPEPLWVNVTTRSTGISVSEVNGNLTFCQQEPDWVGNLSKNTNGPELEPYIELLEKRLKTKGYFPGTPDGVFDTTTDAAVKQFQVDEGLGVDGIVGPNTKNALWNHDGSDRCVIATPLTQGSKTLRPTSGGTDCTLDGAEVAGSCIGSVRGLSVSNRVRVHEKAVRDGSAIELARGTLRLRPDLSGGIGAFEGIHALVEIGVNDYVKGIDEMPISWPIEALEAQAIASRSYGVANAKNKGPESSFSGSVRDTCWCQLWSSTYSQVYAGYYPETIRSGRWTEAANATASQVLVHPTAGLVNAFFSSSNGGASEANEDAWGSSPVAYLRSVPDPWSLESFNPFANWSYPFEAAAVAAKVGLDELTGVAVVETNQSGSARTVRFVGLYDGAEVSLERSGGWVRSVFGLRSNHYDVGWGDASSAPPPPPEPGPTETAVFDDIAGNTFEKDIEWAFETGVTKGCNPPDNTRFCPNDRVTRGQMAAFLVRFLGLDASTEDFFSDDDGSTFEADINALAAAGITKGCGTTSFCPNSYVSREQMAAFLSRALGLTEDSHPGFTDVKDSNTFVDDIARLATAGITKGCNPPDNSRYCPRDSVTRAQMTAFLHRAASR